MKGHGAGVTNIARLNNSFNRLISTSLDGTVKLWEIYSGSCVATYYGHEQGIERMAMN